MTAIATTTPTAGDRAASALLRMENIDKRFPGVHALKQVNFDLFGGEVHVLLGENGAGKSTLMKILAGSLERDSGRIVVRGEDVKTLTPDRSQALGIGMVYQEFSLVPALSVAENIFLGHLPRTPAGTIDWPRAHREARASLDSLGVRIDTRAQVRNLSVAEQQLTEIARILAKQPQILLLDEPTSALSDAERDHLFEIIGRLKARGVGIIYISHRLQEVFRIADRVTVMRDGQVINTLAIKDADMNGLIGMMVGRRLEQQYPKSDVNIGAPVLRVENLSAPHVLHDLSFEVRRGEILGIFGLMGAGQTELAEALFGLRAYTHGTITVDGKQVHIRRPVDAIRHGIGFLVRDRRSSLVPLQPIPPNITLPDVSQAPAYRFLNLRGEVKTAADFVRDLSIRPPILSRPVMYLSGGNQQKVCLARWLFSGAKILIVDEPTRGIDVGAKAEVFHLLDELAKRGVAIIMISSEMPEILAMADRTLVMRAGHFAAEYQRGEATQELLLTSASLH
ncbi:MAG: sugar ABC transporter ATP-binding protein [Anaerolineae bacterium]|nr:sugar ABC transporter ATP-binding protein [Anaerolineae bacterium]